MPVGRDDDKVFGYCLGYKQTVEGISVMVREGLQ